MANIKKPLTQEQQEILGTLVAARKNHELARRMKEREISRRIQEAKVVYQRQLDEASTQARIEVDDEIAACASAADEALIAAYDAGIPVRRIALDGFGNRHDGNVHVQLRALRADGRVGNVANTDPEGVDNLVEFPKAPNVEEELARIAEIHDPEIAVLDGWLTLMEESHPGAGDGVKVRAAVLTMDPRDPYFAKIKDNARTGTKYRSANTATLYLHPASGKLVCFESEEPGEVFWDHPVARFVKDHPDEVREEFDRVMSESFDREFPTSTI